MNPSAIFEDFEKKYQGSFVQVQLDKEEPSFYQLRRILKSSSRFPQLELLSNKTGTILLNYNTKAKIIFKVPESRYIQVDNDVAYYSRYPSRQWKKGLNPNNTIVTNPLTNFMSFRSSAESLNFKTIDSIYNTKYSTKEEAFRKLSKENYKGVALSKNIAIVSNERYKHYIIFYRFHTIGTMCKSTGKITSPLFEDEINDETK
jgi:hypothetical protein